MQETPPEIAYRPIGPDSGSGGARSILRAVAPILIVASMAVMFAPSLLRLAFPTWRGGPSGEMLARMVAFAVLAVTISVSGFTDQRRARGRQRDTWAAFAGEVGGTLSNAPRRATVGAGWEGGPRVEYTVQGRPAVLTCYGPSPRDLYTRLSATVPLLRDVQLQVLANTTANRVLMSGALWTPALKLAAREAGRGPGGEEKARALSRMQFLAGEPVTTGDPVFDRAFLVKATDEACAREIVADASVRSALEQLARTDRYFRVSLTAVAAPGPAQLEVELSGRVGDAERVRNMQTVLTAMMERLDRSDVTGGASRRAAS
jgi:hypothetical protein